MNEQISRKLWVLKFCLKVVYPKYNCYYFLVFLSIKYRIWCQRRNSNRKNMDVFEVKTIPLNIVKSLIKEKLEENLPVLLNKCIIVSKEQFIQLGSENLFYLDNGVLWVALKLTPDEKRKHKEKQSDNKAIQLSLHFMTSEIHKKLWTDAARNCVDNVRIVPIVGSKHISENIAFTNENEFYNITSCFGINMCKDISVTFHPMPSLDSSPKIAAAAEVSLIVNDYDLANDFIKEVLSNYFETPKLVSTNDIFSIELTPDMTAKYHYKYLDLVQSTGKLYFKCKKVCSDLSNTNNVCKDKIVQAYFIVKGVTQLTLGENVHSLKPKDEYFKPQQDKNQKNILHLCPTGLRQKFEQLQETILPFLSGEMNDLLSSMSTPIIPMLLLTGSTGSGRHLLIKILAKYNGMNALPVDCNALQSSTAKQTESKINATVQKAKAAAPVIVVLDNFEQRYEMLEWFATVMQLNIDGEEQLGLEQISTDKEIVSLSKSARDVLQRVAAKTETFLYGDLDTLLHFAIRESYLKQHNSYNQLPPEPDLHLVHEEDFNSALESIRGLQSQHLDAPKIPKVYWEDIGGLDNLKKELLKTIEFPIKYPHLFKNNSLKRSGILLYGPPGCGKTLVAKAVSTELNVSFMSVKGPELLNMYIGQSEENVRKDADTSSFVFIMGATNRPDLLEQSLLRPGRLDKLIYVGPYRGLHEKTCVLKALCRNYKLRDEVDLEAVAAALPDSCTGADLLQVVSTARSAAVRALVAKLHAGAVKESELSPDSVILGVSEMLHGVESFRSSVTDDELEYYESLKSQM
ncbi:hypothetical protein HF086_014157 [Spodoptera exigua]|uniref:AAA+ ATPase domain-containing protein n=1 Tax=Spodoptera exigua TaxID=7107 RepID=A0A922MM98_SPOEX|nr:hypothetical protein HF086_014157 [Spodoptera exigua]